MKNMGALLNVLSSSHEHFKSVLMEGLWGLPSDKTGVNKVKWDLLREGCPVLLYFEHKGVKGIWAVCEVVKKRLFGMSVEYWIQKPQGYPYHIFLKFKFPREIEPRPGNPFKLEWLDQVKPIKREELASRFGIKCFKAHLDRWSIYLFGEEKVRGVTYPYSSFKAILDEMEARNASIKAMRLDHEGVKEIIYRIGQIQGKYPYREYRIEDKFIDVVWRRTPRSVPYIAFEVSFAGNLYSDLVKLKHAYDLWNAIPVLVATEERAEEAKRWIEGSFHEIKYVFRVLTVSKIKEFYEIKEKMKRLENELGLL